VLWSYFVPCHHCRVYTCRTLTDFLVYLTTRYQLHESYLPNLQIHIRMLMKFGLSNWTIPAFAWRDSRYSFHGMKFEIGASIIQSTSDECNYSYNTRTVHVGSVTKIVAMEQDSHQALRFPLPIIIPPMLHSPLCPVSGTRRPYEAAEGLP
jgi:hypothetical protein